MRRASSRSRAEPRHGYTSSLRRSCRRPSRHAAAGRQRPRVSPWLQPSPSRSASTRAAGSSSAFGAPTPCPGAGLAGDRARRAHAHLRADRLRQDAGRVPVVPRSPARPSRRAPAGPRLLYVSPLKALAYDVERNLRAPLAGMRAPAARARRAALPRAAVAVRTGDTPPARARGACCATPPDILITTPESLYLLLTSRGARDPASGRDGHRRRDPRAGGRPSAARTWRSRSSGSPALAARDPQRIGAVGDAAAARGGRALPGRRRPAGRRSSTPACARRSTSRSWCRSRTCADLDRPAGRAGGRRRGRARDRRPARARSGPRSTPSCSSSSARTARRSCSSTAAGWPSGWRSASTSWPSEPLVRAHHGSLAREQRAARSRRRSRPAGCRHRRDPLARARHRHGRGRPRACRSSRRARWRAACSASAAPATRSARRSQGRIFPKFRGDLLEARWSRARMREGAIEAMRVPAQPARRARAADRRDRAPSSRGRSTSCTRWCARADPYRELAARRSSTACSTCSSGRYPSDEFAELRPRLVWDRGPAPCAARDGRRAASRSSTRGTIPDRGLYGVYLVDGGGRVGELDEEMVYEARAGEVFLLGAATWRIEEITRDRVIVSPAPGEPGKMPFWHGERSGRPVELGARARRASARARRAATTPRRRRALLEPRRLDERAAREPASRTCASRTRRPAACRPTARSSSSASATSSATGACASCRRSAARVHAPWALALERAAARAPRHRACTRCGPTTASSCASPTRTSAARPTLARARPDEVEDLRGRRARRLGAVRRALPRERGPRAAAAAPPARAAHAAVAAAPARAEAAGGGRALRLVPDRARDLPRAACRTCFDLPALRELLRAICAPRDRGSSTVETERASPFAQSLRVRRTSPPTSTRATRPPPSGARRRSTLDRDLLRELLGEEELRELLDAEALAEVEARAAGPRRARRATPDALHDLLRRVGDLDARRDRRALRGRRGRARWPSPAARAPRHRRAAGRRAAR